jgi:phosphoglycerol transferase MdoB-like AlkP superfamily enzyme
MKLINIIKILLISLVAIAGILGLLRLLGIWMITWESVLGLIIIIWVPLAVIILGQVFLTKLAKVTYAFAKRKWVNIIIFFVILALLFLIEIIPAKVTRNCMIPPCGYRLVEVSAYKVFSYLFNYPEHVNSWATPFTFSIIMLEILAAFALSKPGAQLVVKIKAKLCEKAKLK